MTENFGRLTGYRILLAAAMLAIVTTTAAVAQNVVVFVNGEPITAFDVDQRTKFIQITTQKAPPRQEVLQELIDEKLKVREGKRWGMELSDADVDAAFAGMASRMRLTPEQLTQNFAKSGINVSTLKQRIRAEQIWLQVVRGRYQSSLQLSDSEVLSALETSKTDEADSVSLDYVMRPILLLVPPGSSPAVFDARRKEAEGLRSRFKGCEEGIAIARAMRDVAVRDQFIRSSVELPPELRKLLDGVPIGQLTPPEVTKLGVEMFALCNRHELKADTPSKRAIRDNLYAKRFEEHSKQYLQRLRREALIDRR